MEEWLFFIDRFLYISYTLLQNIVRNVLDEFHALLALRYRNHAAMDRIRYVYDYAHNLDLVAELLIIVISYMDELDSLITLHLLSVLQFDHGTLRRCGH